MPTIEHVVSMPKRHPAQARVVREAKRFNVLQCGRRFGKTLLGLDLAMDAALDGGPVGWFAPTYKMLLEAWREFVRHSRGISISVSQQERRLELLTGGVIECWSLDDPDAGRTRKYQRVIIDEAGIVRDLQHAWPEAIRPTLADLKGDAWFLGTPKGRNYFDRLYAKGQQGDPDWMSWRFATTENPYIAPSEIEAARRDLPEAAFQQEFLGIPSDDGGNPFGLAAIRLCIAPLSRGEPVYWGWDLAKSVDWTVGIALDKHGHTCRFERWQSPWETTLQRILTMTGRTKARVDSTGVGDPIVEMLVRGRPNFEGYKFSQQSKQQLMEGLAVAIQQRSVTYPDGPIVNELETFEYEYTRSGVRYSAPQGLFDDCVCALALAVSLQQKPVFERDLDAAHYVTLRR